MKKNTKKFLALLLTGSILFTTLAPALAETGGAAPASVTGIPARILVCDEDLGDLSTPKSGTMHGGSYSWDPSTNTLVLDGIHYNDSTSPADPNRPNPDSEPLPGGLISIDGNDADAVQIHLKSNVTYDTSNVESDAIYARKISNLTIIPENLTIWNANRGIVNDSLQPSKLTIANQGQVEIKQFKDYGILSTGDISLEENTFRAYSLKNTRTPQACVASAEGSVSLTGLTFNGCTAKDLVFAGKNILLDKSACYAEKGSKISGQSITPEIYPDYCLRTGDGNITVTNDSYLGILSEIVAILANGTGPDRGNFSSTNSILVSLDGTPNILKTANDTVLHGASVICRGTGTIMDIGGNLSLDRFTSENGRETPASLVYHTDYKTELPSIKEQTKPMISVGGKTCFYDQSVYTATTNRTLLESVGDVTVRNKTGIVQNGSDDSPDVLRTKGDLLVDTESEVHGPGILKSEKTITFNQGVTVCRGLEAKGDIRFIEADGYFKNMNNQDDGIYSHAGDIIVQNTYINIQTKGYGIHTGNGLIHLSTNDLSVYSKRSPILAERHSPVKLGAPDPAFIIAKPFYAKDLKPACTPWQKESADSYCTKTVLVDKSLVLPEDGLISDVESVQTQKPLIITQRANYSKVDAAVKKANALDPNLYKNFDTVTKAIEEIDYHMDETDQRLVDKMAAKIEEAIEHLVYKPADYTSVREALQKVPEDLDIYTYESAAHLVETTKAIDLTKNITEQEQVNRYARDILAAIKALEELPADYQKVDEALATVPKDLSIYTDETVQALNAAIRAVDRTKTISEQSVVDGYAKPIASAVKNLKVKPADYTAVDEALASVPKDLTLYTAASVKALNDAKAAVDRTKKITEQNTVDNYARSIRKAIQNLVYLPADYRKVDAAIAQIPADLSIYTEKSVKALNDARNAVDRSKNKSEQKVVDRYALDLLSAIKALKERPADYTKVDEALSSVPKDLSVYTAETVKALKKAVDAVDRTKTITEQSVVDGYAEPIASAVKNLKLKPADYRKVDAAIAQIPADLSIYTEASVKALNDAKAAVDRTKKITEQNTVDNYAESILAAIRALDQKPADYTKVDKALASVPKDLSIYTAETVKALNDAIKAVDRTKTITEQSVVDGYAEPITSAVKALKLKPADYRKVDEALASVPKDLSIYTETSVKALNDAKAAVDRTKKITEQNTVDGYAQAITSATKALELKPADYTKVDKALASVPKDLSIYTAETVKALNDAVEAVDRTKKITEQSAVDGYAQAITSATKALELKPADYTKVDKALASVPKDLSIYTEETVKVLKKAVEAVDRTKKITEQSVVDGYVEPITSAVKALELKPADYAKVDKALASVPKDLSIYTEETVQVLNAAIDTVDRTKKITEQSAVDGYAQSIASATKALELKPADYTGVDRAIERANRLNPRDYYNFEIVEEALAKVDRTKKITEQELVDQYARDIYRAMDRLKRIAKPIQPELPPCNLTVTTPEAGVVPNAESVSPSVLREVRQTVKDVRIIGDTDCAGVVSATKNGAAKTQFTQPLTVTIPLSAEVKASVKDPSDLSLAVVKRNANGYVTLDYVGGSYQAETGQFVAKVDEAGTCLLVEKPNLTKIVLTIDKRELFLNDRKTAIDTAPFILGDRTMVPIRFISEAFSSRVDWEEATRTVTITGGANVFRMTVGVDIPGYGQAPVIRDSRTFVPLRYISETLGANVIYDPFDRQVIITG